MTCDLFAQGVGGLIYLGYKNLEWTLCDLDMNGDT
jgi:hypothetical protein